MSYENISYVREDKIATITLNRPNRRNALSVDLMLELTTCLRRVERENTARVVILAAAGNVFCSGHDLSEMLGQTIDDYRYIFDVCTLLMETIQSIPQPVIAQVQGMATAAGCQLVATCDLAIAVESATFATPGVKIGLFCTTPMVALSRVIGSKRALQMLLTGELVGAYTALRWGLINEAVSADELVPVTHRMAKQIAEASDLTVSVGKKAFYAQIDMVQSKAYDYAKEVMSTNALTADAQEGISAFLGKRPACWTGK